MSRGFIVVGPERSGTRMLTESLISVGVDGDSGHVQKVDKANFHLIDDDFVIRRSFPHGHIQAPNLQEIANAMRSAGHLPITLVILRQVPFVWKSREREGWDQSDFYNVPLAMANIFVHIHGAGLEPHVVSYETFVTMPEVREELFSRFDLPAPTIEYFNANDKYEVKL